MKLIPDPISTKKSQPERSGLAFFIPKPTYPTTDRTQSLFVLSRPVPHEPSP